MIYEPGDYINSGFLVMNLARLRRDKTYEVWVEQARRELYRFPDQDILNAVCRGRILYLPIKFNFCYRAYYMLYRRGLVPPQDHHDLKYNAVMLHYLCTPKPWKDQKQDFLNSLWWQYAKLTPFYESLLAELQGKAD